MGPKSEMDPKKSPSALRSKISSWVHGFSDPHASWGASLLRQFLLFSALFIGLALAFWLLSPNFMPKPSWSYSIQQTPLDKNSPLMLHPADYLVYTARSQGRTQDIRLDLSLRPGCRGVFMLDSTTRALLAQSMPTSFSAPDPMISSYSVCLGTDGNERSPANLVLGNNVSFSNLSWPYFQPWMLAVKENWSWSINTTMHIEPYNLSYAYPITYRVIGRSNATGRDAYLVEVSAPSSGSASSSLADPALGLGIGAEGPYSLWIDAERRVLLRGEFANTTLELTDASFYPHPADG